MTIQCYMKCCVCALRVLSSLVTLFFMITTELTIICSVGLMVTYEVFGTVLASRDRAEWNTVIVSSLDQFPFVDQRSWHYAFTAST